MNARVQRERVVEGRGKIMFPASILQWLWHMHECKWENLACPPSTPPPPATPGVVSRMQGGGAEGTNPVSMFACTPVGHGHVLIMSRTKNTGKKESEYACACVCVCVFVCLCTSICAVCTVLKRCFLAQIEISPIFLCSSSVSGARDACF